MRALKGSNPPDRLALSSVVRVASLREVTATLGTVHVSKASARSADGRLITLQGEPAPCHFNANPVRRVSVALSTTLQRGHTAPNLRRTTNVRPRHPGSVPRCVPTRVVASKWHCVDRVLLHARQVDRADPDAGDRKTLRRDLVIEALQPPDLNRTAAAALLRIVLQGANHEKMVREGKDRSVQS